MRLVNHPVLCNYYVTYRCNARCGFCDIWEKPSPYANLKLVAENLRNLKQLGVKVIDFTGGEPLLHQQIDQLCQMAKEMGFITTLTTNCLLYPKLARRLQGKVDMLHFSLDSSDPEQHNRSRGVDCFGHVMESIDLAQVLGEKPDILFTVFENNVDQIPEVYQNIVMPNNLMMILNPVFQYAQVDTGKVLSPSVLNKISSWGNKKNIYLNQGFIQLRRDGGNHTRNPICKAGSSTVVISPENKLVVPCYHLGVKEFPINNDLLDLYRSAEVQAMIALEGKLPACEGCTINCYMQPSFAVEVNKYWWKALPSTLKYIRLKRTWKKLVA